MLLSMPALNSFSAAFGVFSKTFRYLRESRGPSADIESLKLSWALDMLDSMCVEVQVHGSAEEGGPLILVGNHISYLDIPLLMRTSPGVTFLAKSEISRWPVIGTGARTIGTTFVKREDKEGRANARIAIAKTMRAGRKLALFPSGTTTLDESKRWSRGAFEIAEAVGVPVQPFRIRYSPLRRAAYIDDDFFPAHLYRLAETGGVRAQIEFHRPVRVKDARAECDRWRLWAMGYGENGEAQV